MKTMENQNIDAKTRRNFILDHLNDKNEVRITELSELLDTSIVTIRKDLEILEQEGLLERIHGGAVRNYGVYQTKAFLEKMNIKKEEKKRIARAAADLVESGESVLLNYGTTSLYLARELKKKNNIIVLTNSLQVYIDIGNCKNIATIFLGGQIDPETQVTYGVDALEQLRKYTVDKLFMGMDGVSIENGLTTYSHVAFSVTKQMVQSAKKRYLIVDDEKIGKTALVHVTDLTSFNGIITNKTPETDEQLALFAELGLEIIAV